MNRVHDRSARRFGPSQPFCGSRHATRRERRAVRGHAVDRALDEVDARAQFGDAHAHPRAGVAAGLDRNGRPQRAVHRIRVIPAQVPIDAGRAFDRACRALVERELLAERRGRDQPVQVARRTFDQADVGFDLRLQARKPFRHRIDVEFAPDPARPEHVAQEPASARPCIDLLGQLFEQLPLRFADLERRRMAQVAEVVQMIVDALKLGRDDPEPLGPPGDVASRRILHRLHIRQRLREAVDARHPLGQQRGRAARHAFELLLDPAMLEKQVRVIVENPLADVVEDELRGFEHVGAHGPERQKLHMLARHGRQPGRGQHDSGPARTRGRRRERRGRQVRQMGGHEPLGLRMAGKPDPAHFHDLPLVPAEQRADRREARHGIGTDVHRPAHARLVSGTRRDVSKPGLPGRRIPRIDALHSPAAREQLPRGRLQFVDRQRGDFAVLHCAPPPRSAATV